MARMTANTSRIGYVKIRNIMMSGFVFGFFTASRSSGQIVFWILVLFTLRFMARYL
jgi:hypothetical protein